MGMGTGDVNQITNMETIIIQGIEINIKQYGFSEDEILNSKLKNLIEEIIIKTKKMYGKDNN